MIKPAHLQRGDTVAIVTYTPTFGLPILYNVNIGHAEPICVLPIGVNCRLDADRKTLTLLEPATA